MKTPEEIIREVGILNALIIVCGSELHRLEHLAAETQDLRSQLIRQKDCLTQNQTAEQVEEYSETEHWPRDQKDAVIHVLEWRSGGNENPPSAAYLDRIGKQKL